MNRGELWTMAANIAYATKPRPVLVVQDDEFDATESVTVCGVTTNPADAGIVRPAVLPSPSNGLNEPSRVMVDKLTTVPRSRLGSRVGQLDETDMERVTEGLIAFLGLGRRPRRAIRSS